MSNLIGKTIGPYRILEQIGIGGMATVYRAYQPSMDRDVAIKVLPPHLSQEAEFTKRFQREARAIARLEHAHILPVYDYGEHEGLTYIAMRYIQAGTLKDRLSREKLSLDEINRLIGQIGSALDYAHRLGVIHRDVKPSNVLIDAQGNTYLTDFGLARMMESSQQLTGTGVSVGTPAYMSPEQGQGTKADHRSDVYSLGVILYEMVTGHVPYEAETPMAVLLKHITDPLPLPRTLTPDVPEAVERVILKALAKDPVHRFQTAGEMVEALNLAVHKITAKPPQPSPVRTPPPRREVSLITRLQQTWARPRGKVGLIGGCVAFLALLALGMSLLPGKVQITVPVTATTTVRAQVIPTQKGETPIVMPTPTKNVVTTTTQPTLPVALVAKTATPPPHTQITIVAPYRLRARILTNSDWTTVRLISSAAIFDPAITFRSREAAVAKFVNGYFQLEQSPARAQKGGQVEMVVDFLVRNPSEEALTFEIERGQLGSTTVELMNYGSGQPLPVGVFAWSQTRQGSSKNTYTFHVPTALLTDPGLAATIPAPIATYVWQPASSVMVFVPAGKFSMGSNDAVPEAKPQHEVYLDAFWIDRTEVTIAQYQACVDDGGCTLPEKLSSQTRSTYFSDPQLGDYPVVNVTWDQAEAYCRWTGRRLPSEAEWEKAARGDDGRIYPWGNQVAENRLNLCDVNCPNPQKWAKYDDTFADTAPVGMYLLGASPFGALDMAGNILEWTADWFSPNYYAVSPVVNPLGAESGDQRSTRGGGYGMGLDAARTFNRGHADPTHSYHDTGFRCALSSPPPSSLIPPRSGSLLEICQGTQKPQICVRDLSTGEITPLTKDLNFDEIGGGALDTNRLGWAPGGGQIYFDAGSTSPQDVGDHQLYLINSDGSSLKQLTTSQQGNVYRPVWSPDGEWIAFHNGCGLSMVRPDGSDHSGGIRFTPGNDFCLKSVAWSPDSRHLALTNGSQAGKYTEEVIVISPDGNDRRVVYTYDYNARGLQSWVVWSPDGQWIALIQRGFDKTKVLLIPYNMEVEPILFDQLPWWWLPSYLAP